MFAAKAVIDIVTSIINSTLASQKKKNIKTDYFQKKPTFFPAPPRFPGLYTNICIGKVSLLSFRQSISTSVCDI